MIKFENISKKYGSNVVLDDVSFEIESGKFVYIVGRSGSGKTTIFKLISRIETADSGLIYIDGYNITDLAHKKIAKLRQNIGFIFQDYKLIPSKTALENIELVLEIAGKTGTEARETALKLLEEVGIPNKKDLYPSQLSGGEKQRVAIARALALEPAIILADEPTGNLDSNTTKEIFEILKKISKKGTTLLLATHDSDIIDRRIGDILQLKDGKILHEKANDLLSKHKVVLKEKQLDTEPEVTSEQPAQTNKFLSTEKETVQVKKSTINIHHIEKTQLDTLDLEKETKAVLINENIKTISQLQNLTDLELSKIVGITNVWKIRDALSK